MGSEFGFEFVFGFVFGFGFGFKFEFRNSGFSFLAGSVRYRTGLDQRFLLPGGPGCCRVGFMSGEVRVGSIMVSGIGPSPVPCHGGGETA